LQEGLQDSFAAGIAVGGGSGLQQQASSRVGSSVLQHAKQSAVLCRYCELLSVTVTSSDVELLAGAAYMFFGPPLLLLLFVCECGYHLQDADGKSAVDRLFGLKLHTKLKCEETGEEFEVGRLGCSCRCSCSCNGHVVAWQLAMYCSCPAGCTRSCSASCDGRDVLTVLRVLLHAFCYVCCLYLLCLLQEDSTVYTLKCNISVDVNYLHQGVSLALVEDREKNSAQV
jgi:hypothetical protein